MNKNEFDAKIDAEIEQGLRCGKWSGAIICANLKPCREHDEPRDDRRDVAKQ